MTESIIEICHDYIAYILKDICDEHGLDYSVMQSKYLSSSQPILVSNQSQGSGNESANTSAQHDSKSESESTSKKTSTTLGHNKKKKQEYLEVVEFEHGGDKYYIDKKSNIYSFDKERPRLLGIRLVDGSIKFYE